MLKASIILFALFAALAPGSPADAQEVVFVIRHAEKQDAGADPGLTEAGRMRANAWARMLGKAGVEFVVTTDARRTRETGGIIAESLGIAREEAPMADVAGLIDLLTFDHAEDKVLVVGHTETIPAILSHLGVAGTFEIDQDDYANMFIVTSRDDEARLVNLRMD